MKHCIAAVLLTAALTLSASTDLIRFVPGNVQGMAWIDMAQGWRHPIFQRFRSNDPGLDQQCRLLETKLAQFRMRPEDAIKNMAVFYGGQNSFGSVFFTPILEPQFDKMLAGGITKGAEQTIQVEKKSANGYRYYLVRSQFKGKRLPDSGFTYVGTNQVLMAPVEQLNAIRSSLSRGTIASNKQFQAQIQMINTNAPFWTVFRVPPEVSNAIAGSSSNPTSVYMANVTNGAFSVDSSGKSKRDFFISGFLTLRDASLAQQMAQQLQLMPMACDNTGTAMRVSESMNVRTKGNTLFLRMILPENMQKMLMGGMYQQQYQQQQQRPQQAAPAPVRTAAKTTTAKTNRSR